MAGAVRGGAGAAEPRRAAGAGGRGEAGPERPLPAQPRYSCPAGGGGGDPAGPAPGCRLRPAASRCGPAPGADARPCGGRRAPRCGHCRCWAPPCPCAQVGAGAGARAGAGGGGGAAAGADGRGCAARGLLRGRDPPAGPASVPLRSQLCRARPGSALFPGRLRSLMHLIMINVRAREIGQLGFMGNDRPGAGCSTRSLGTGVSKVAGGWLFTSRF